MTGLAALGVLALSLGQTLGPETAIEPYGLRGAGSARGTPAAFWDGTSYVVIWFGPDFEFTRVDDTGEPLQRWQTLYAPTPSVDVINTWLSRSGGTYLLTWWESPLGGGTPTSYWALRFSGDGGTLDQPVDLGMTGGSSAAGDQSFIIAGGDQGKVFVQRMDTSGAILDSPPVSIATVSNEIGVGSNGHDFLAVWSRPTNMGATVEIRAARVSASGQVLDPGGFVLGKDYAYAGGFVVTPNGSDYLVGFNANDFQGWKPWVSHVSSATGTALDMPPIAFDIGTLQAVAPTQDGFVALSERSGSDLWLDPWAGGAAGAALSVTHSFSGGVSASAGDSTLSAGPTGVLATWVEGGNIYSRALSADGTLGPSRLVSDLPSQQQLPSVARTATGWRVGWTDDTVPTTQPAPALCSLPDCRDPALLGDAGTHLGLGSSTHRFAGVYEAAGDVFLVAADDGGVFTTVHVASGSAAPTLSVSDESVLIAMVADAGVGGSSAIQVIQVGPGSASAVEEFAQGSLPSEPSAARSGDEVLVAWANQLLDGGGELRAVVFAADGGQAGGLDGFLLVSGQISNPGVSASTQAGTWLMAWETNALSGADVHFAVAEGTAAGLSLEQVALPAKNGSRLGASAARVGGRSLLTWHEMQTDGGQRLVGSWFDPSPDAGALNEFVIAETGCANDGAAIGEAPDGRSVIVYTSCDGTHRHRMLARDLTSWPIGSSCTTGDSCETGFCVDGVCCDSACGGSGSPCAACSRSAGAVEEGRCSLLTPTTICRLQRSSCDATEVCDGVHPDCPPDLAASDGAECDDGNSATTNDHCEAGTCQGTQPQQQPPPHPTHHCGCDAVSATAGTWLFMMLSLLGARRRATRSRLSRGAARPAAARCRSGTHGSKTPGRSR